MNKQIVKGDELMVFKNSKSIAYATSHTFSITGNTIDVSSKDHGYWGASEVGNITWELSSENLFTDGDYTALFDAMIARTPVTVAFGFAGTYDPAGIVNNAATPAEWSLDTSKTYFTGPAYITSLSANANKGENATYSVTFTGSGALTKTAAA